MTMQGVWGRHKSSAELLKHRRPRRPRIHLGYCRDAGAGAVASLRPRAVRHDIAYLAAPGCTTCACCARRANRTSTDPTATQKEYLSWKQIPTVGGRKDRRQWKMLRIQHVEAHLENIPKISRNADTGNGREVLACHCVLLGSDVTLPELTRHRIWLVKLFELRFVQRVRVHGRTCRLFSAERLDSNISCTSSQRLSCLTSALSSLAKSRTPWVMRFHPC